jgi:hypothetical protein
MADTTYKKFVKRWQEVTDLPPQNVGPFTPAYQKVVKRLKVMPWPALAILSLGVVFLIYIVLGSAITLIASILQRGF